MWSVPKGLCLGIAGAIGIGNKERGGVGLQKIRTAFTRGGRPQTLPEAAIITLGIACCAGAIVLVLAVAIAAAM